MVIQRQPNCVNIHDVDSLWHLLNNGSNSSHTGYNMNERNKCLKAYFASTRMNYVEVGKKKGNSTAATIFQWPRTQANGRSNNNKFQQKAQQFFPLSHKRHNHTTICGQIRTVTNIGRLWTEQAVKNTTTTTTTTKQKKLLWKNNTSLLFMTA